MADFSNIPVGLKIPTQIPLDVKKFKLNEAALIDLGLSNNLAFTYHDGISIYCFEEKTTYIWREVQVGEENTGLRPTDYTYPNNVITFGIDYSNKTYNFFKSVKDLALANVGEGVEVYQGSTTNAENTTYNFRTLKSKNLGINGLSLFGGFQQNTNDIDLIIRLINTNTLSLKIGINGELYIDLPSTANIPGLFVNDLYIPTLDEFNAGITKGNGTASKPFTNTVTAYVAGVPTIVPNTAIQNALDVYAGGVLDTNRKNPALSGQKIIIQDNGGIYYHPIDKDLNYSNLNIQNEGSINFLNPSYIVNMDNTNWFDANSARITIKNVNNGEIRFKKGFLNSGSFVSSTLYVNTKYIYLEGGTFIEEGVYNSNNTYMLNSDPTGVVNGTAGCNNDGGLAIECKNAKFYSVNNGIYKVGGKSRIEFSNCELLSSNFTDTINSALISFNQTGGIIRMFDSKVLIGGLGGRTNVFNFTPSNNFQNFSTFIVRNTRFTGSGTTWFNKTSSFLFGFDMTNSTSLFFTGTQLFNSTNLWNISFNNNAFEFINIDFTKVDFTLNNSKSSINFIGNNVIEQLVKHGSRIIANGLLPKGSAFINTNGMPITTPDPTWTRDIVI